ncbi:magnesium-translocating P-type ATPase [Allosphingosinicella flava]|uniref:Magnesium-transporting ATPase, P-type 1 n=1 Tax=Allosphingosinicella flava TaxID=2771430 RepID=A0A7T2GJF3_9SPHN|nr:magnesium-translocating P-type ATPase [Sphingosinicella flava]QPQ54974.1 magnesium-translocating P-type ATPase [Sphingosinicella flava]
MNHEGRGTPPRAEGKTGDHDGWWAQSLPALLTGLSATADGLDEKAAAQRLKTVGPNSFRDTPERSAALLLLRQFGNPLVLILLFGAAVSMALKDWMDASIIVAIVAGSALLGFYQEFRASRAVAALQDRLKLTVQVLRSGREMTVPDDGIVPGDVVLLSAGNLVPADGRILQSRDFLVSEAALTGESFPVEKSPGLAPPDAPVAARTNSVFMGTSVRSGTARILITQTGGRTAYGRIAARLRKREPETDFERGVRSFGGLLLKVMTVIVIAVLTMNQMIGRPFNESLLFAVALAVGLSPELLPAIVSVTLAAGARDLSRGGVIVRKLAAIENLGSMEVLCTDKTGTLTAGVVRLHDAIDVDGASSDAVRLAAYQNAALETGIKNPLDAALLDDAKASGRTISSAAKIDEIPYDFSRRRLTIVVVHPSLAGQARMITKGAFADVLATCATLNRSGAVHPLTDTERTGIEARFRTLGESGFRVLAVAERTLEARAHYATADERDMTLIGLLLFADPPKDDVRQTLAALLDLGVRVKIISGDNRYLTRHLAEEVGIPIGRILTGGEIRAMPSEALARAAAEANLFVEIDPQQKEGIVRALQHGGHSVGFLGDGINDAPALKAADVGISVDQAVDVARETADVVLLRPDLEILRRGVLDGRKTFANTLKYISITTSANFGNMVSMAIATPVLPFLPLLPKQILLNNFLSDLPSAAISTDNVDAERLSSPQRWDVREIQKFMIVFGLVSSAFDLLTFAVLLLLYRAGESEFQTAWFVVSLMTELVVVLVLRTRHLAWRSRPSPLLLWTTIAMLILTLVGPYLGSVSSIFGLMPLSIALLAICLLVVILYVTATEVAKFIFYD